MNCSIFAGPEQDYLYANFNQDYSCLAVGTRKGFRIYNCEPFGKCYEREDGAAGICEMLFSSSLVALAGAGEPPSFSPRKLQIVNTKRQTVVCELSFPTKVLNILMNRKRLVVVLESKLHIYDLSTMKIIHTIDTPPNPTGVGAMSPSAEMPLLAYPSSEQDGSLQIFNTFTLQPVCAIQAHRTLVTKMAFNIEGTLLATASDRGTIVRVFNSETGQKLHQLRRGSYAATIHYISFSLNSNMVAVTSDSDTVHIFKLIPDGNYTRRTQQVVGNSSSSSAIMNAILPERVGEALDSVRDFAHLKLAKSNMPSICAISSSLPQIMVVTGDGCFLVYQMDLEKGGECQLLRKHSLNPLEDGKSASLYSL